MNPACGLSCRKRRHFPSKDQKKLVLFDEIRVTDRKVLEKIIVL